MSRFKFKLCIFAILTVIYYIFNVCVCTECIGWRI